MPKKRKVVYIHEIMLMTCKPYRNQFYYRLFDADHGPTERVAWGSLISRRGWDRRLLPGLVAFPPVLVPPVPTFWKPLLTSFTIPSNAIAERACALRSSVPCWRRRPPSASSPRHSSPCRPSPSGTRCRDGRSALAPRPSSAGTTRPGRQAVSPRRNGQSRFCDNGNRRGISRCCT